MAKNGEITDRALAVFMDGGAGPMAAAAGGELGGLRNQVDQQIVAVRPDRADRKALPKGQKRINIVHKNAGLLMCLPARTSSIKPAFLFLSSRVSVKNLLVFRHFERSRLADSSRSRMTAEFI